MYQIYKKFKIKYFNRKQFAKVFDSFYIFFFYLLFIDNFNIYRNIYCILKVFYLILAYFSYKKRKKLANIFILILDSYKVAFYNIIKVFCKLIKKLDISIEIKINNKRKIVYVSIIVFLNNILQQTNNNRFSRYNTNIRCYICFYFKN